MSNSRISNFLVTGVTCAVLVACNPVANRDSELNEAENTSDIWLSAANANPSGAGAYDLLVSSPLEFDTIILCESTDADSCSPQSRQYARVQKSNVTSPRSFYLIRNFQITDGMDIAVKAQNANGQARKRSIRVAPPGQDPFATADSTTPSSSSSPDATNGTGGTLGQVVDRNQYAFQGMTSQYRYWAPQSSTSKAVPLVVYLHGDTGSNYGDYRLNPQRIENSDPNFGTLWYYGNQTQPTLDMARTESANEPLWNEVMFVAILSPQSRDSDQMTTWASFSAQNRERKRRAAADYVHNLVQTEIYPKFNIDKRNVYFVGQSGGAVFLTTSLIPLYGNEYRGGGVALCGGQPPMFNFTPNQQFKDKFKLHFQTTSGELKHTVAGYSQNFYTIIPVAQQRYAGLIGNPSFVTLTDEGSGDHCYFEANSRPATQPTILAPVIKNMRQQNGSL